MVLKRDDVYKIIMTIRSIWDSCEDLNTVISISDESESSGIIYGISNEYLSDFVETLTGKKINVTGNVEQLFTCPCCGFRTLTEEYNVDEGTGYDICPLCGWEDDGTTDIDSYRSINKGSISDYRKILLTKNITNRWLKSD